MRYSSSMKIWQLSPQDNIKREALTEGENWMDRREFAAALTETLLVLIPKVDSPQAMKEFRPIALCNVLCKIRAEVLANRLRGTMPAIISPTQAAFVPGRAITDNVVVAFETIHYMKQCRKGS
ncbi:hypothetical protein NC653_010258 [Populus alba x Populus x berolinensis]|uniref:Reverse transcriptase domain-containing protein n=1 Tax=Populus alba x Populus x berolinensis TaxID=444605 RepID=A0AAD6QZQ4_9ROSI|nr:hypothetical protein NC653_010258 [Populus alba x Populus x berolinensis]